MAYAVYVRRVKSNKLVDSAVLKVHLLS